MELYIQANVAAECCDLSQALCLLLWSFVPRRHRFVRLSAAIIAWLQDHASADDAHEMLNCERGPRSRKTLCSHSKVIDALANSAR